MITPYLSLFVALFIPLLAAAVQYGMMRAGFAALEKRSDTQDAKLEKIVDTLGALRTQQAVADNEIAHLRPKPVANGSGGPVLQVQVQ